MSQHKLDPQTLLEQELRKPKPEQHKRFIEFLKRVLAENSNTHDPNMLLAESIMRRRPIFKERYSSSTNRATRRQKTASGSNRRKTRNASR
jgi:hypothetical protein